MEIPKREKSRVIVSRYGKSFLSETFKLPNGKREEFVIFQVGNIEFGATGVMVIPITIEGKLVMINQFRYGANCLVIEFPGGNPKGREIASQVVSDELLEETGYTSSEFVLLSPVPIFFEPAFNRSSFWAFLARGCQKVKNPTQDETEFLEHKEMTREEIIEKVRNGEIRDSKTIAMLGLFFIQFEDIFRGFVDG